MPEISRFFGIVIKMYFGDHLPPHFHAEYNEQSADRDSHAGSSSMAFFRRVCLEWLSNGRPNIARNCWTCGSTPQRVSHCINCPH